MTNQMMSTPYKLANKFMWWAGPDSDRRPSARQADVLTRLDDRPTCLRIFFMLFSYIGASSVMRCFICFSVTIKPFPKCLLATIVVLRHMVHSISSG